MMGGKLDDIQDEEIRYVLSSQERTQRRTVAS
jgi:hypothetical protein